jgi:Alw26I/Eco31I/Esp3I family type II restriction m6 adenine DNA methyltransferase
MGILHKLVFILGKLDPHNERWKEKQIEKAAQIPDATFREKAIADIEEAFERNALDYGRKLYLIENCIYGVDIQPIAVQIAKLRCFISLVVDERIDDRRPNRGIRPLPNLETKFVAANTLLGIERPQQMLLRNAAIDQKEAELAEVRRNHFTARTPKTKEKYRQLDQKLRTELGELLRQDGFLPGVTEKLARWDPYDQNTHADFFDPEWMFGVTKGFDVMIGDPPYGLINKRQNKAEAIVVTPKELEYYKTASEYAPTASGMINIFRLFILKSINLLHETGIFAEIFPLAFVADVSAAGLRKHILNNFTILCLEAFPERDNERKRVFEAAKMSVCIMLLKKSRNVDHSFFIRIHHDRFVDVTNDIAYFNRELIALLDKNNFTIPLMSQREVDLVVKVYRQSITFSEIGHCYTGEIDLTFGKPYLTDNPNDAILIKGAIIDRYLIRKSMSQGEIKFLNARKYLAENAGRKATHFQSPRIVMQGITGVNERIRLKMTLIKENIFCANSVNYMVFHDQSINLKFALGILNSSLLNFTFSKFSTNSNVNGYEVDNLPFPQLVSSKAQHPIINLVDQILIDKKANPNADTSALEGEIDRLVYKL